MGVAWRQRGINCSVAQPTFVSSRATKTSTLLVVVVEVVL